MGFPSAKPASPPAIPETRLVPRSSIMAPRMPRRMPPMTPRIIIPPQSRPSTVSVVTPLTCPLETPSPKEENFDPLTSLSMKRLCASRVRSRCFSCSAIFWPAANCASIDFLIASYSRLTARSSTFARWKRSRLRGSALFAADRVKTRSTCLRDSSTSFIARMNCSDLTERVKPICWFSAMLVTLSCCEFAGLFV